MDDDNIQMSVGRIPDNLELAIKSLKPSARATQKSGSWWGIQKGGEAMAASCRWAIYALLQGCRRRGLSILSQDGRSLFS